MISIRMGAARSGMCKRATHSTAAQPSPSHPLSHNTPSPFPSPSLCYSMEEYLAQVAPSREDGAKKSRFGFSFGLPKLPKRKKDEVLPSIGTPGRNRLEPDGSVPSAAPAEAE